MTSSPDSSLVAQHFFFHALGLAMAVAVAVAIAVSIAIGTEAERGERDEAVDLLLAQHD